MHYQAVRHPGARFASERTLALASASLNRAYTSLVPVYAFRRAPRLGDTVAWVWSWRGKPAHDRERILPDGNTQLLVNLASERLRVVEADGRPGWRPGAVMTGPYDRPFVIDTRDQRDLVGVAFVAGGGAPFFRLPISALRDDHVPLAELWGAPAADALRERLLAAPDDAARLDVLEETLLATALRTPEVTPRIAAALAALRRRPEVESAAERAGLSRRAFTRVFHEEVGLPPKRWARIQRFQAALAGRHGARDLTELAHTCGFYDHAHFARELRAFAGEAPSVLFARTRRANHVILG